MDQNVAQPRKTLRLATNPKTLHRKAMEKAAVASPIADGDALEQLFPQPSPEAALAEPADAGPAVTVEDQPAQPAPALPATCASWSDEDERGFRALAERRRQSGYKARGKDVSAQRLTTGKIVPNDGTVMATIVALVRTAGVVSRSDLLDRIATTTFAHPKAKPTDREWAQNYVAGALRSGGLAVAEGLDASGGLPAGSMLGERSPDVAA